MLWGRDENMLPALSLGAPGAVGSTYNYAAPLYLDLMAAHASGDLASARLLQQQSIDMIRLLGKYGGIATGKAFMRLVGMDCGGFRLPVRNMSEDQYVSFASDAERVGFHSFCSKPLSHGKVQRVRPSNHAMKLQNYKAPRAWRSLQWRR